MFWLISRRILEVRTRLRQRFRREPKRTLWLWEAERAVDLEFRLAWFFLFGPTAGELDKGLHRISAGPDVGEADPHLGSTVGAVTSLVLL
jgi:hypothetical protein